jgi:hypothetical protein
MNTVPHPQSKFSKITIQNPKRKHPTPLKILKNSQGTMSNVGQHYIKKCPGLASRGKRWQLETIKEKQ